MKIALVSNKSRSETNQDVIDAAVSRGHSCELVQLDHFDISNLSEVYNRLLKYDLVYWRHTGHGMIIRNIMCNMLKNKVNLVNSIYSEVPFIGQKIFQMHLANENSILIPKTLLINSFNEPSWQFLLDNLKLPFIAKLSLGSRGAGVFLINERSDFESRKEKSLDPKQTLFQEFIPNSSDYRVIVIGYNSIGVMKRERKEGFKNNISLGAEAKLEENKEIYAKVKAMAELTCRKFGIEIAGIDIVQHQITKEFYLIETNSGVDWGGPGFQKITGVNVGEKIIDYFETL